MRNGPVSTPPRVLPPNDPRQYDDLAGEWWRPDGAFAMLHWLARSRAALVPPATRPDALLVDLGCGAGLLAPHLAGKGYRHVGVDLTRSALAQAAAHGVTVVNGDATAVPLVDGCADVVAAGELLEHVPDWRRVVAEACRLLRPGGLLVLTTQGAGSLAHYLRKEAIRDVDAVEGIEALLATGHHYLPAFGEGGDWGVEHPEWGMAYMTLEWLAQRAGPDWTVGLYQQTRVDANQDLVVLQRRASTTR
jgi:SAM-dependent methyltransferase